MLKYPIGFLLITHGLAHISGVLGMWTSGSQAFRDEAWTLSRGIAARSTVGKAFGILWMAALVGMVAAGLGLVFGQPWWPAVALVAAIVSLAAIVPWVKVVPSGAWAGAVFDIVILVALIPPWSEQIVAALS
jgi:hypothetical protein